MGCILKAAVDFSDERIFHVEQSVKGNQIINGEYIISGSAEAPFLTSEGLAVLFVGFQQSEIAGVA